MTAISASERVKALANPLFMFDVHGVIVGGMIQVVCLLAVISVSIIKPWGRRDLHRAEHTDDVKTTADS